MVKRDDEGWISFPKKIVMLLFICQFAIFGAIGVSALVATDRSDDQVREHRKQAETSLDGVAKIVDCFFAEFEEHRINNQSAHLADAKHHGYTYDVPPEFSPPTREQIIEVARRIESSCDQLREHLGINGRSQK